MNLLITGGAGFIGSHVVRHFVEKYPQHTIINLDNLTYAGNVANLRDIEGSSNYFLVVADVADFEAMYRIIKRHEIDGIIHLAAESHVDRSITDPFAFARTNVIGSLSLLEAFRRHLAERGENEKGGRYYQVSTDEVYGSLMTEESAFTEETPYSPRSPYSAAKASADHFVRAYHETFGLDVVLSSCSNNFGPYQFPEKLLPLFTNNIVKEKPLPVYGNGENIRDWLYVQNHVDAIEKVFFEGRSGETYNIGGHNEWRNIDIIKLLIELVDKKLGRPKGTSLKLITYVTDRPGHDLRYAINSKKITTELGWEARFPFLEALEKTVDWYLENQLWLDDITSGRYLALNDEMRNCQIDNGLLISKRIAKGGSRG